MLASRLLSILLLLQSRGRVSARELAAAFEVSVRTIYRDADQLSAAGVPIFAERGRNGGFQLLDGYRTRLTGLDRSEAEALALSGLPRAAEQLGLGMTAARTRLKLLASLPDQSRADAERVEARFHFDPVEWFQEQDDQDVLPELARAVWDRRCVRMTYERWKGVVERQGLPLGIVLKANTWYLVAAVAGTVRTYRVSRILRLETLADTGSAPEGFDLEGHWRTFCEDYENRMLSNFALLRANAEGVKGLARLSRAARRAVELSGPPDSRGLRTLTVPLDAFDGAVGDILRLGSSVEVLAPADLREAISSALTKLIVLYDGPTHAERASDG